MENSTQNQKSELNGKAKALSPPGKSSVMTGPGNPEVQQRQALLNDFENLGTTRLKSHIEFVRRNPLLSVMGGLTIGLILGMTLHRRQMTPTKA